LYLQTIDEHIIRFKEKVSLKEGGNMGKYAPQGSIGRMSFRRKKLGKGGIFNRKYKNRER
jgi:hypothetical protein